MLFRRNISVKFIQKKAGVPVYVRQISSNRLSSPVSVSVKVKEDLIHIR